MNPITRSLLALCFVPCWAGAAAFTVGGYSWDSDNAVTSAAFTEGGPGFIGASTFPEGAKSIGNLLTGGGSSFADITNTITNSARHTLTMDWSAAPHGSLLTNEPGNDLVIYEVGSLTAPEAYAVSVRNASTGVMSPWHYFMASSFDTPAAAFATAIDLSNFGPGIQAIDQIAVRSIFNSAHPGGGDRVDVAGGSGQGVVSFNAGSGNLLNRVLEPGPMGTPGEYAASRLDADIVYVVGLHNTVPEPGSVLLLAGAAALAARRRRV